MVLATNTASMNASFALMETSNKMQVSVERLGTGLRIKKAQDDPSGNAIADKLRTQASSIKQGVDNATTAITMLQIADKAMAMQSETLDNLKSVLLKASTSTTSESDLDIVSNVVKKLITQIDEIASQSNFSGIGLLQSSSTDDSASKQLSFLMDGEFTLSGDSNVRSNSFGLSLDSLSDGISARDDAIAGLKLVDDALSKLNEFRSGYGSLQQQVESSMRNMMSQQINMNLAESVVRDVDFGLEYSNLEKSMLTYKAGSFALTQANLSKDNVLNILV